MKYYYVYVGDYYVGVSGLGSKDLAYQYTFSYAQMVIKEYVDAGYSNVGYEEV